ncbi:MAG: flagellar biosynthesis protein FlhF [Paenibacillaceae bacterium]|nr:flagellar biosynthesis protein FlhF [Paenibacillaceae bacterium]
MRVKRYVVDSMPAALERIRSDLGKDAIILNTKEVRSGGFLGLFGKKKIEVIAATDQSAAPAAKAGGQTELKAALSQVAAAAAKHQQRTGKTAVLDEPMPHVPDVIFDKSAPPEHPAAADSPTARTQARFVLPQQREAYAGAASLTGGAAKAQPPAEEAAQARSAESAPPPRVAQPAAEPARTAPAQAATKSNEEKLFEEIRQMKAMMLRLSNAGAAAQAPEPDPLLARWQRRLADQELHPDLIAELLAKVSEDAEAAETPLAPGRVKEVLRRELGGLLGEHADKQIAADTKIAHFVGPTGVGKTTTIAKLAAEQTLKYHRKVGLITSDTYRIAAVEQLKTYATILNIPLEVVFSPLDLTKAFEQLGDRDIIFMDTAGRNFRNEMYVSELNALLQTKGKSETFLVLSLTTKYKDMKAITGNFSRFKLDKVLFTKLDETDSYGSIVNLLSEFPLRLSYVTNGQNVPDDLRLAEERLIIERLLEETDDE